MKYRKKPVVIEAIKCSDAHRMMGEAWKDLPEWFRDAYEGHNKAGVKTIVAMNRPVACIDIITLEGTMRANLDDWIIRGVKGELYPCKPDIFESTYDPVA